MITFLQTYGFWIFLIAMFILMMRMHNGHNGQSGHGMVCVGYRSKSGQIALPSAIA